MEVFGELLDSSEISERESLYLQQGRAALLQNWVVKHFENEFHIDQTKVR